MYLKSPEAAKIGVTYWQLVGLLRAGKMAPPAKDSSGDYVWTEADLLAARAAVRDRKEVTRV